MVARDGTAATEVGFALGRSFREGRIVTL